MTGRIHSLGHVALATPDLEQSLTFFCDAVGLEEVERDQDTVYLRAPDEFIHHSLSLRQSEEAGVDHIGWQTADEASLEAFSEYFEERGIEVRWIDADEERGQGTAIRFRTPTGHRLELYYHMEKPDAPPEKQSKLRNRAYAQTSTNAIAPRRIDHVQIWDPEAHALAKWLQDHLGMRVQECYDNADGSRWGTFLSACGVKIEAAVIQHAEADGIASLNHVAYKVDRADDLFDAADAMKEFGFPTDGIGQHSISRGKFLYARDPVSDHTIEFSAGGYLVFDPEWEPIHWHEGDLDDRQWIGQIEGGVNVPYEE